jgi:hypothetical protein
MEGEPWQAERRHVNHSTRAHEHLRQSPEECVERRRWSAEKANNRLGSITTITTTAAAVAMTVCEVPNALGAVQHQAVGATNHRVPPTELQQNCCLQGRPPGPSVTASTTTTATSTGPSHVPHEWPSAISTLATSNLAASLTLKLRLTGGGDSDGEEMACTQAVGGSDDGCSALAEEARLVPIVEGEHGQLSAIELPSEPGVVFSIGRKPTSNLVLTDKDFAHEPRVHGEHATT